ncbi:hypothetical protein [Sinorhizobium meliloti]|uniref:hypothetical protein n=1 Tax=Rhizobium meliloti TaxID=382 RepID=UPI0001E4ACA3|nr:hypothetical protein [Sinorhizobium meliloti]MDE4587390.1 hypothetical protein [Sinorhizobium meliloti]SEJ85718.1 hypothetical protein SAMN04244575_06613 [Sinorhizobium meliloti]
MHNLIELQETYKDSGVGAVAVVAEESAAFVGEALDLGRVVGRFPKSNLRVALDDTGTMNTV